MSLSVLSKSTISPSSEYTTALRLFWDNKSDEAVEYVSKVITDTPDHHDIFQFYRLWIEQLAVVNDTESLSLLKEHLSHRSRFQGASLSDWQALRAIVHLELDEMQAAELYAKTLASETNSAYCMEFMDRYSLRMSATNKEMNYLLRCDEGLIDYFQWETVAKSLMLQSRTDDLDEFLMATSQHWQRSPMKALFKFHLSFEKGFNEDAEKFATELVDMYPNNVEYTVSLAIMYFRTGQYNKTIDTLLPIVDDLSDKDSDVLSLIGFSYSYLAGDDVNRGDYSLALDFLHRAERSLKDLGLPATAVTRQLETMTEYKKMTNVEEVDFTNLEPTEAWLVKLDAQQYFEMMRDKVQGHAHLYRAMGNAPKTDDIVFFAAEDPRNKDGLWRIVSIYSVSTKAVWHPVKGFETGLDIIYQLDRPIEIDVRVADEEEEQVMPSYHPYNYGVYSLEGGTLDIITEAFRQRNEETGDSNRFMEALSNFKLSS